MIKSHLCRLRLSYSIPFPRHAGDGGARSRATSIKISWNRGELVALHLMESPKLDDFITAYTGPKNPAVGRVGWSDNTVWLDAGARKKGRTAIPGS